MTKLNYIIIFYYLIMAVIIEGWRAASVLEQRIAWLFESSLLRGRCYAKSRFIFNFNIVWFFYGISILTHASSSWPAHSWRSVALASYFTMCCGFKSYSVYDPQIAVPSLCVFVSVTLMFVKYPETQDLSLMRQLSFIKKQ